MHGFRADGMLDNACKDAAASGGRSGFCWSVLVWWCGEGREDVRVDTAAAVGKYIWCSCGSKHCCGSGEVLVELLRERTLLRQWGNTGKAPAGAGTAAAVGKYILCSCGSRHCCGSGEKILALLREQALLRQWGKQEALLLEQTLLWQWGKQVALMGEQSLLR